MNKLAACLLLTSSTFVASAQRPAASTAATPTNGCSVISLGDMGALNGFVPSPNDAWHQDITNAPVDPNSAKIITIPNNLGGNHLHPDFSSVVGGNYGIPYTVVDSSVTPSVPVNMLLYPADSDITLYPMRADTPVEGAPGECPNDTNDRHAIVLDRNQCVIYEMWQAAHCNSSWSASNGLIWDMTKTEQRPYGMTSADAAGLSIFEGLVRYDEIVAGKINHALRFTANHTKDDANNGYFTAPASHASGSLWGTDNIMGMRLRMRADFDISGFSQTNQVILRAMKQYGMILADNGSNLFFQGTPDARWNDDDLSLLKAVPTSAFEVVQMAPVYDANSAPTGAAPVIASFTASAPQVTAGTSVVLTPVVANDSYDFIDKVGIVRGAVTVTPTATTTYTLTSRNAFGSSTASTTVKVVAAPAAPVAPTVAVTSISLARSAAPSNFTFKAIAKMSDNSIKDISSSAVWSSSNPAIATISGGQLTPLNSGLVSITAQAGSVISPAMKVQVTLLVTK